MKSTMQAPPQNSPRISRQVSSPALSRVSRQFTQPASPRSALKQTAKPLLTPLFRTVSRWVSGLTLLTLLITLTGCEPTPQPIHTGSDTCDHCRMMITDNEFASQALNNQGKAFKFDSVECMAAFHQTHEQRDNLHSLWVPNFLQPDQWIAADQAMYLHSETLRSPMGLFLSAYATPEEARQMQQEYGGNLLSYEEVRALVQREWLESGDGHAMH